MSNSVTIDDLADPQFSEEARQILSKRETMDIEYSIDGLIRFAKSALDVPLFRGEYLDHLDRFMRESVRDDRLTVAGQKHLARRLVDIVLQRSRMEDMFRRHPEIRDEIVDSPVFIAGLPRSGTTNLSGLVGSDSRLNSIQLWQAMLPYPSLRAEQDPDFVDPSKEEFRTFLNQIRIISPLNGIMKNVEYEGVDEDLGILHLAGTPMGYQNWAYTPEWNRWLWNDYDGKEMYDVLKRTLQYFQWKTGDRRRWLLKNPHHLAFLKTMDDTFDNASYIITHRDPASSAISNAYMIAYLFRETHRTPSPQEGLAVAHHMSDGMIGGLVRDIDKIDESRVVHVYFHNYMDDVWGMLKGIYQQLGLEWNHQLESELETFMNTHKRGGGDGMRLKYLPERDFGQTREQIRAPYQFYLDKFPVRIEREQA